MTKIDQVVFDFLKKLKNNNTREWMEENRAQYLTNEKKLKRIYEDIRVGLSEDDEIDKVKIFRINRDVRFSNNKTPYNIHRSVNFGRAGAHRRGSYYLRIEPGGHSRISGGFFSPEPADLKRIRKEFEMDSSEIRAILNDEEFRRSYGGSFDPIRAVKTAPRGFDKKDINIDLIRLQSFFVTKTFNDSEVLSKDFVNNVVTNFKLLRPFFDYMSEVLTTDLNGESILDSTH
ncbi:DUF2461 domain-containing protein [Dokdonia sp. Hel_I_53]|uniref:DUF2461 domain-containing protein n=1 Tax=Dokdonia sp. Hel_I_53 TaxID=1566287 RepID=UPI0011991AC8|nr:DUF2461 domain-containing protein [Dokdonia sp. Hel_I_53]TVZ51620.1 uncharacterized protein (TIGR02453 family) [Dokdonia sp. Hel_I_53]